MFGTGPVKLLPKFLDSYLIHQKAVLVVEIFRAGPMSFVAKKNIMHLNIRFICIILFNLNGLYISEQSVEQ